MPVSEVNVNRCHPVDINVMQLIMNKIKTWLGKLALVALLFAIIVGWQAWKRQAANDKAVQNLFRIVEGHPLYGQYPAFFDESFSKFHDRAFKLAYKNERFGSSFDEGIYKTVLFTQFQREAEKLNRADIHAAMTQELKESGL